MIDFKLRECGTAEACRSSRGRLSATMPVSVVLVDDPRLVRDGLKTILEWGSEFSRGGRVRKPRRRCRALPQVAA
jgi:hypothetical protein